MRTDLPNAARHAPVFVNSVRKFWAWFDAIYPLAEADTFVLICSVDRTGISPRPLSGSHTLLAASESVWIPESSQKPFCPRAGGPAHLGWIAGLLGSAPEPLHSAAAALLDRAWLMPGKKRPGLPALKRSRGCHGRTAPDGFLSGPARATTLVSVASASTRTARCLGAYASPRIQCQLLGLTHRRDSLPPHPIWRKLLKNGITLLRA
jgi:hypothetical protein